MLTVPDYMSMCLFSKCDISKVYHHVPPLKYTVYAIP